MSARSGTGWYKPWLSKWRLGALTFAPTQPVRVEDAEEAEQARVIARAEWRAKGLGARVAASVTTVGGE